MLGPNGLNAQSRIFSALGTVAGNLRIHIYIPSALDSENNRTNLLTALGFGNLRPWAENDAT